MDPMEILINSNDTSQSRRKLLLELCNKSIIKVNNIYRKPKGFTLVVQDSSHAEKLFTDEFKGELSINGFQPILSNKLKAYRTVLVNKTEKNILETQPEMIKEEIARANPNKLEVTDIFKIPNSSILKITFKTSAMVDMVMNEGFNMFLIHISHHVIKRDDFIELTTCFNCFAINKHFKNECPEERRVICSKCGANHFYKECNATPDQYSCVNCKGNHSTLSSSCPLRKAAIKRIRNERRTDTSYGKVLRRPQHSSIRTSNFTRDHPSVLNTENPNILNSGFNFNDWNKTTAVIQFALVSNLVRPGSFSKTYNDLCADNNLPTLNLNSFNPPTTDELQNAGIDASRIINNLLQSHNEFPPDDIHSSTLRDNNSLYQSLNNETDNLAANRSANGAVASTSNAPPPGSLNTTGSSAHDPVLSTPYVATNNTVHVTTAVHQSGSVNARNSTPITQGIKGYKVSRTVSNTETSIRKGLKDGKIILVKDDRIITDTDVIDQYIITTSKPVFDSVQLEEFNQLRSSYGTQ